MYCGTVETNFHQAPSLKISLAGLTRMAARGNVTGIPMSLLHILTCNLPVTFLNSTV